MPARAEQVAFAIGPLQPILQEKLGVNSSVLATRVAIEVARRHGVTAEAVPVHVEVYNPAYVAYLERGEGPAADDDP